MRKKKNKFTLFGESLTDNEICYNQYADRLTELATSMFKWKNLPKELDERFIEMTLFSDGYAVFFYDEELEQYVCLQCMIGGQLNIYRIPTERTAYASNGYNYRLNEKNSVIIYNNYIHKNSIMGVQYYAKKLTNIDRAIDVNTNAQKTPILIQCEDSQRLTMTNLYKEYSGNQPFIFGTKGLDINGLKVLKTDAPFVADKLYELKTQTWNEALTYLGISNINSSKKERMIQDEVMRNNGGVVASRYSRLDMRKQACKQINEMFGLNIEVEYQSDYEEDIVLDNYEEEGDELE